jgi:hypothetical protein
MIAAGMIFAVLLILLVVSEWGSQLFKEQQLWVQPQCILLKQGKVKDLNVLS